MAKKAKKAATKTTTRSSGKKPTTRKKAPAAGGADKEVLLVGSKIRAEIKNAGCNTGGDAIDGLNYWVHWLIQQGVARAAANGRKTVRSHDFIVQ